MADDTTEGMARFYREMRESILELSQRPSRFMAAVTAVQDDETAQIQVTTTPTGNNPWCQEFINHVLPRDTETEDQLHCDRPGWSKDLPQDGR